MDWLTQLLEIVKIPTRVLLPATWLFTGALAFVKDSILRKLGLLAWRNEHKTILGLVFLITSCLIIVYLIWYLKGLILKLIDSIKQYVLSKTLYSRTAREIQDMSDAEIAILIGLYNTPDYTKTIDCGHPVVQGLIAQQYIHMGASQLVTADRRTGTISGKVTLQPCIYRTFNHYKPKLEKEIATIAKKLAKAQNADKQKALQDKLNDLKEKYYCVYEGGINNE